VHAEELGRREATSGPSARHIKACARGWGSGRLEEADGEPVEVHGPDRGWQGGGDEQGVEQVRDGGGHSEGAARGARGSREADDAKPKEDHAPGSAPRRSVVLEVPATVHRRGRGWDGVGGRAGTYAAHFWSFVVRACVDRGVDGDTPRLVSDVTDRRRYRPRGGPLAGVGAAACDRTLRVRVLWCY